jgi:hypothetical protein
MRYFTILVVAAAAFAGAPARAYEPIGAVIFRGSGAGAAGASFDEERLVGPAVNMKRTEGGWVGDLAGQNLNLTVSGKKLYAPNVTLMVQKDDKGNIRVEGQWFGARLRVDFDEKRARGRFGGCSLDLKRTAAGHYNGDVGCIRGSMPVTSRVTLKLLGEAATGNALPQLALALVAVLPSAPGVVSEGGSRGPAIRDPR